jgi:hypothetical protein
LWLDAGGWLLVAGCFIYIAVHVTFLFHGNLVECTAYYHGYFTKGAALGYVLTPLCGSNHNRKLQIRISSNFGLPTSVI